MDTVFIALKRYSTKAFDPNRKLTVEQVEKLKTSLQFSLSSTNSQPWYLIVANADEGKTHMAKSAAGGFAFNGRKILDASHVMMFCTKTAVDGAWLERMTDQEENDGRSATPEMKATDHKGRTFFVDMHRRELKDGNHRMAKQVYLNVGNFLLDIAAVGLDAALIEGFDSTVVNVGFGLKERDLTSVAVIPVGHHSVEDFNAMLPKPHLPLETTLTEV